MTIIHCLSIEKMKLFTCLLFCSAVLGFKTGLKWIKPASTLKATIPVTVQESSDSLDTPILINYLTNKFKDCRGDDCRIDCDLNEIRALLTSILPPVTPKELETEVNTILKMVPSSTSVSVDEFLSAVVQNSYWKKAGTLVVKELIYLDCLYQYYFENRKMLDDEDFDQIKEDLTWEGSAAVTMSSQEAHFVEAVAAHRRGQSILSDSEYEKLKSELNAKNSWVVKRVADPLERMGLNTFLSYLHRAL